MIVGTEFSRSRRLMPVEAPPPSSMTEFLVLTSDPRDGAGR